LFILIKVCQKKIFFFVVEESSTIVFTYDFSKVQSSFTITFDGTIAGTLVMDGTIYDAANLFDPPKIMNISYLVLTLQIPSGVTSGSNFYYNVWLADGALLGS